MLLPCWLAGPGLAGCAGTFAAEPGSYASWKNGPAKGADYFPIAVWLQAPKNAPKYKAIGINLYVGLWKGPTDQQLAELTEHGMPVICAQNDFALAHLDTKVVVGWMHGDEPDNAQSRGKGKGYGPPIRPEKIVDDYKKIKANDPSRPVMLNLGQGVAWDRWHGRGVRTNHPEDYLEYVQGCDIVSFDIYPVVHRKPDVAGKLWYVARGVDRLRKWTRDKKTVWNCIECTRISNPDAKPTADQVRAEVWMSIIHGSKGIVYFCHQFKPRFIEAGLLADEEMAKAVGAINRQIHGLAPVINSPTLRGAVTVRSEPASVSRELAEVFPAAPIATMVKKHRQATYVFAVAMEAGPASAVFEVRGAAGNAVVEVLGEHRTVPLRDGEFRDRFKPNEVHLYRIE